MAKIALRTLPAEFLDGARPLAAGAPVITTPILDGPRHPIALKAHRLSPEVRMAARAGSSGTIFYIWSGSAVVGTTALASGSAVAVEHGAEAEVVAGAGGAMLIEMGYARDETPPRRDGGHVHLIAAGDLKWADHHPDNGTSALYLDSRCPSCELWLHVRNFRADMLAARHFHTEDEVMIIVDGQMSFGSRTLSRGALISIENGTIYSFKTGPGGANVINFRSSEPFVTVAGSSKPPISEVDLYRDPAAVGQ